MGKPPAALKKETFKSPIGTGWLGMFCLHLCKIRADCFASTAWICRLWRFDIRGAQPDFLPVRTGLRYGLRESSYGEGYGTAKWRIV